jgi:class 3 adenylate cyclase
VAARIGAAAIGAEILVSDDVLGAIDSLRFRVSEPKLLRLKGVEEEVEVRSVDWR